MPFDPSKIPTDVIPCIVQSLPLCKDLYRCALVNRVFYEAAIPVLYRTLDTRVPTVVSYRFPLFLFIFFSSLSRDEKVDKSKYFIRTTPSARSHGTVNMCAISSTVVCRFVTSEFMNLL